MNIKFEQPARNSPKVKLKNCSNIIICPNSHCKVKLPKSELDNHLIKSCPGTIVNCVNQSFGCLFKAIRKEMINHEWQCKYRQKSPESSLTSVTLSSTSSVFQTDANSSQELNNQNGVHLISSIPINNNNNLYTPLNHADNDLNSEDVCLTITNPNRLELGLSFVGGFDTPLQCIVVQEIFRDGLIAADCRMRPGDQLMKVNEFNLTRTSHDECREILSRICTSGDTIYLTVHRDLCTPSDNKWPPLKEEILTIVLEKPPNKKIGLKLAGKTNKPGLYIQEVLPDTLASQDGRLKKDDRILKINDGDFVFGTQEEALIVMQNAQQRVTFKISRFTRPQTPDLIRAASSDSADLLDSVGQPMTTSLSFSGFKSTQNNNQSGVSTFGFPLASSSSSPIHLFQQASNNNNNNNNGTNNSSVKPVYREEVIEVSKQPGESLGMSVAGGVNSQRGDTPVYITGVAPSSCLLPKPSHSPSRAIIGSGIGKGDIVLAVNEFELLGLSHERAVEALKTARDSCNQVTVRVLKVPPNISGSSPISSNSAHDNNNFIPSWLYWLRLPSYCQIPRSISLARDPNSGSIGFSIVGGNDLVLINNGTIAPLSSGTRFNGQSVSDQSNLNQSDLRIQREPLYRPIMIKSIVFGSPAYKNGRLKCGDILVSINDNPLTNVAHSQAVSLFKSAESPLRLELVSWPGTIV